MPTVGEATTRTVASVARATSQSTVELPAVTLAGSGDPAVVYHVGKYLVALIVIGVALAFLALAVYFAFDREQGESLAYVSVATLFVGLVVIPVGHMTVNLPKTERFVGPGAVAVLVGAAGAVVAAGWAATHAVSRGRLRVLPASLVATLVVFPFGISAIDLRASVVPSSPAPPDLPAVGVPGVGGPPDPVRVTVLESLWVAPEMLPVTVAVALLGVFGVLVRYRPRGVALSGRRPGLSPRALVAAGYDLYHRVRVLTHTGSLPSSGIVSVSGTVSPLEDHGPVVSPVDGEEGVVCAYRIDGYEDPTNAKYASGVSESAPYPGLLAGVEAVPFGLRTDDGTVVVDPAPWDPENPSESHPGPRQRSGADYRTATLEFSTVDRQVMELDAFPDPFEERLERAFDGREECVLAGSLTYRVEARRLDPGTDVTVVGWSVAGRDHLEADVVSLPGPRRPFRIAVDDRRS